MRNVHRFMKLFHERIPPIPPTRHAVGLSDDDGRLAVSLSAFYTFFLDEEDMDKSPEQLVEEFVKLWNRMPQSKLKSFPDPPPPPSAS